MTVWVCFVIFLLACFAVGTSGGLFPPGAWYRQLTKPPWTPPNWVFPTAWTTLYILMAAAGARVAVAPDNSIAMALWSLQIALNGLWTPVFFGLKRLQLGLIVLIGLWVSVAATLLALWQVDQISGLLFVPYLIWVTIAGALNYAVLRLNPDVTTPPADEGLSN
ncbi:MAG: TspO/MBR family protein [Pseudomonadota bacterium]